MTIDPQYLPNGTYEDIIAILARSEQRRYASAGIIPPPRAEWMRWIVEPILNVVGIAVKWYGEWVGSNLMSRTHAQVMGGLAGKAKGHFDPDIPELTDCRALVAEVLKKTGKAPAVLCLMSHPPVTPETIGINVEMGRQGFLGLQTIPSGGHARIVIAVDAFALDMVASIQAGVYAGFMGTYHLGIDRMCLRRLGLSRRLLSGTAWWSMPWKTLKCLSEGGKVSMVLSGGVPITARILYSARESVWTLRKRLPPGTLPSQVIEKLKKIAPDFAEFFLSDVVGVGLRVNPWRMIEAWIVARLAGLWPERPEASVDADLASGRLTEAQLQAIRSIALAAGLGEPEAEAWLKDFKDEYARETPYRRRFFLFLLKRVLSKGRPLVLLPMSHEMDPATLEHAIHLVWGRAIALWGIDQGMLRVTQGPGLPEEKIPLENFAQNFVASHYT